MTKKLFSAAAWDQLTKQSLIVMTRNLPNIKFSITIRSGLLRVDFPTCMKHEACVCLTMIKT